MRARSLKPALFKNEILGSVDPLATLLFEGLWCLADREGRLEDRPKRIKAEIFPYRDGLDVEPWLAWLAEAGFIMRYKTAAYAVIQVVKFKEHQRPHSNETASELPDSSQAFESTANHGEKSLQPRTQALRSDSLFSDSLLLTPESILMGGSRPPVVSELDADKLEIIRAMYPKRHGDQRWPTAKKHIRARLKEGHTWDELIDGTARYAQYCKQESAIGTGFVKQAATFFGTDKGFTEAWNLTPVVPVKRYRTADELEAEELARETANAQH